MRAPGVLDDPVRLVTGLVQANDGNAVVEASWAVVLLRKDAGLVVAPAVVASGHCDAHGTVLNLVLHVGRVDKPDRVLLGPRLDHFPLLISARAVLSLILVCLVGLGADFSRHLPVVGHPAAIAAVGVSVAVDTLLLGESDDWLVSLDGLHGLLHRGSSEGPAGAASALVLHGMDFALVDPADGSVLLEAAAASVAVVGAISGFLGLEWDNKSLHLSELGVGEIARLVHAECDSGASVFCVEAVDGVFVCEPDLHAVVHLLDSAVVFAELSNEVLEL